MGYSEMNQRDSFWTTWLHLVLWTDLEREMIEKSASFQRPDGKIPTTVLPVIERGDDIDINEYFNLRIARYYEWTMTWSLFGRCGQGFKSSIEYLKGMDRTVTVFSTRVHTGATGRMFAEWMAARPPAFRVSVARGAQVC